MDRKEEKDSDGEKEKCTMRSDQEENGSCQQQEDQPTQPEASTCDSNDKEEAKAAEEQPSVSSDSCRSDSRVLFSPSSDSLDALEEDDFISCSSSSVHPRSPSQAHCHSPLQLHPYAQSNVQPHLLAPPPAHSHPLIQLTARTSEGRRRSGDGADPQLLSPISTCCTPQCPGNPSTEDRSLCFAELSRLVDFLPSPPEASEEDDDLEEELRKRRREQLGELDVSRSTAGEGGSVSGEHGAVIPSPCSLSAHADYVFNFDHGDARCYYSLCSNITPDSAHSVPRPPQQDQEKKGAESELEAISIPILQPPPGFGDSSSDDEFFDARDGFTSPEDPTSGTKPRGNVVFFHCTLHIVFHEVHWNYESTGS